MCSGMRSRGVVVVRVLRTRLPRVRPGGGGLGGRRAVGAICRCLLVMLRGFGGVARWKLTEVMLMLMSLVGFGVVVVVVVGLLLVVRRLRLEELLRLGVGCCLVRPFWGSFLLCGDAMRWLWLRLRLSREVLMERKCWMLLFFVRCST